MKKGGVTARLADLIQWGLSGNWILNASKPMLRIFFYSWYRERTQKSGQRLGARAIPVTVNQNIQLQHQSSLYRLETSQEFQSRFSRPRGTGCFKCRPKP
jgi:hypothetical protein